MKQQFGPEERATIGADRSYARKQVIEMQSTDIALGFQKCTRCERRQAVDFAEIAGRPAPVCGICRDDLTLDETVAAQRRWRAQHGSR